MTEHHVGRRPIEFAHFIVVMMLFLSLLFAFSRGSFVEPGQGFVVDLVVLGQRLFIPGLNLPFGYRLLLLLLLWRFLM